VAEVGAKRIVEIDPQNANVKEIVGNLPIGLPAAPGGLPAKIPTRVGVGSSGTIYFSTDIEKRDLQDRQEIGRQAQVQPPRLGSAPPVRARAVRGASAWLGSGSEFQAVDAAPSRARVRSQRHVPAVRTARFIEYHDTAAELGSPLCG
jgi:hypothetical protein